jgi:hypothetical protein
MKKLLTILAGIVLIITILAAGGCNKGPENKADASAADDSLTIYLTDSLMRGSKHLFMSDSRKPGCGVIDNLQTVVNPGDTVFFKKGKNSRVKTVDTIYQVENIDTVFNVLNFNVLDSKGKVLYVLEIDSLTPTDTIVKYVIEFTVKQDTTIYIIDPYLRIPPGP